MDLTDKQQKFIDSYISQGDKNSAVIYAGYTQKLSTANQIACQLLKNPKIVSRITQIKLKTAKDNLEGTKEFTKNDLVSLALRDYEQVELTEANRPRFLELAGKGAGIIGASEANRPNQTVNIQINLSGNESTQELWELTRKLIGNE